VGAFSINNRLLVDLLPSEHQLLLLLLFITTPVGSTYKNYIYIQHKNIGLQSWRPKNTHKFSKTYKS